MSVAIFVSIAMVCAVLLFGPVAIMLRHHEKAKRKPSILTPGLLNSITPGQQVRDPGEVDPRRCGL